MHLSVTTTAYHGEHRNDRVTSGQPQHYSQDTSPQHGYQYLSLMRSPSSFLIGPVPRCVPQSTGNAALTNSALLAHTMDKQTSECPSAFQVLSPDKPPPCLFLPGPGSSTTAEAPFALGQFVCSSVWAFYGSRVCGDTSAYSTCTPETRTGPGPPCQQTQTHQQPLSLSLRATHCLALFCTSRPNPQRWRMRCQANYLYRGRLGF